MRDGVIEIDMTLDPDFTIYLESLHKEFGEDMLILNGIHHSQIDFSQFINGFIDKNVADVTIDQNANAHNKDVRSLLSEKGKSQDKLLCLSKIFYEIKKKYGLWTAREWLYQEFTGGFYLHDASTATLLPYCFSGATKVITNTGVRKLESLVGKDIKVLNKYHDWEDATVERFGKQKLTQLVLTRNDVSKVIMVTSNHRWFVRGEKRLDVYQTDQLKEGMRIPYNTYKNIYKGAPSLVGVANGYYLAISDNADRREEAMQKYTAIKHFSKEYFDQNPAPISKENYFYGCLMGYFAIDGKVTESGKCIIKGDYDTINTIKDYIAKLGMPISYIDKDINKTDIYTMEIDPNYLTEEFFIIDKDRERFLKINKWIIEEDWVVQSINPTNNVEETYCVVAPITNSFTLDNNVLTHNCYAYDLSRLAKEGLFFIQNYNNEGPKHLTTFLDDVIEFISFMSNRSSGACGIPNVLVWTYYFWKKDCEEGYEIKNPDYYIRQIFQKLIYRLNQPFMRVDQTAFVNVSIFDREYAESLFGGLEYPDGTLFIDCIDEFIEHEKIFMEVVSDIRSKNMFTFPVLTYSLLYKDGKFVDEEFARWCSDHNTKWNDSNFFISGDVTTLSNCPMDKNTNILYYTKSNEIGTASIGALYYMLQGDSPEAVKLRDEFCVLQNGLFAHATINKFDIPIEYKITLETGDTLYTTANHLNLAYGKEYVETKDLTTDDYLPYDAKYKRRTNALFKDISTIAERKYVWVKIKEITKIDDGDTESYCVEVLGSDREPIFTLASGIVTHNCRLLSDTSKLSGFINSIGGTALSIGSVKVNTINLMKIAYEATNAVGSGYHDNNETLAKRNQERRLNTYLGILEKRTLLCCKTLDRVRHIIKRNIEKGLLPNYCDGGVEMDKQYCTIGILGLYEVMEYFGLITRDSFGYVYYTDTAIDFASKIFDVLNDVKDNFTDEFSFNIESVPAERAAVILCQKDNLIYEQNEKSIYSNQWIPLSEKCTINEKLRTAAILDNKCSGGAIAHINLEANFPNTDAAWDNLNKIAQSGVIYFAYNTRINECKNHHGFVGTDHCPECGEPVYDTYQRIVGYLVPTRAYSKDRFKEFTTRQWYDYAEMMKE